MNDDLIKRVVKSVTDEFCEAFQGAHAFRGFTARMVGAGVLPEHVNPNDERVKAIIQKCQKPLEDRTVNV